MNVVDRKFIGIVSLSLDKFVVKNENPYRANFRCPICGDSKTSTNKCRGWFLEKDNSAVMYCHNCGASLGLSRFLKMTRPALYDEYIIDKKFGDNTKSESKSDKKVSPLDSLTMKRPKFQKSHLSSIKKISSLPHNHKAKVYVESRKIPSNQHYRLYWAPKFNEWTNTIIRNKFGDSAYEEGRLIIPFIDEDNHMFGYQGRSLKPNTKLRYITIMIDDVDKVFGIDKVSFDRKYYIVEGPIDSLFLDNAIAMAGSDGKDDVLKNIDNAVYMYDMEPRNPQIVNKIKSKISEGRQVVMLPYEKMIRYGKDINDFVLNGIEGKRLHKIIDDNTYSGLAADLELSRWSKV